MANYATYLDVERLRYGTQGQLDATQQARITALLGMCHGAIVGYLGSEPASTDNLVQIEAEMCRNILWNQENPSERPLPVISEDLSKRLNLIKPARTGDYITNPRSVR